MFFIFRVLQLS